jgi:hypothetical protein
MKMGFFRAHAYRTEFFFFFIGILLTVNEGQRIRNFGLGCRKYLCGGYGIIGHVQWHGHYMV